MGNDKYNEEYEEERPFLDQLTDFIDVVGKHGIGVALVAMSALYIFFYHPFTGIWELGIGYAVAIPSLCFGCWLEYRKLAKKGKI